MKKRVFSVFLVLALLLAALAGCGADGGDPDKRSDKDEEAEQLLGKGWYEVYDEDDDLVGYLEVKGSKIIVYDEHGREDETLRYDYNAKKELYTIDDGELFGSGEFTVEKRKKVLTLITGDDDEYTLEEIDEEDMPAPGSAKTPGYDDPVEGNVELPTGAYAAYDGRSLVGYLKVTRKTLITYGREGDFESEVNYSYDRDGNCLAEQNGYEFTLQFTYEQDGYYMNLQGESVRLEPIRESEIPEYHGSGGESAPGGVTNTSSPGPVSGAAPAGTLAVAIAPDYPPFAYFEDKGGLAGIDVELMLLVADRLGMELEIVVMDFDSAMMSVQNGISDLVVGVVVTEERKEVMTFTDSYYVENGEIHAFGVEKSNLFLLDAINDALADLTADGTIFDVIDRYI